MQVSETELSDRDLILQTGGGNPGALSACVSLIQAGKRKVVERMFRLGITGSAVWICWKDLGKQTAEGCEAVVNAEDIKARLAKLGY